MAGRLVVARALLDIADTQRKIVLCRGFINALEQNWPVEKQVLHIVNSEADSQAFPLIMEEAFQAMHSDTTLAETERLLIVSAFKAASREDLLPNLWNRTGMWCITNVLNTLPPQEGLELAQRLEQILSQGRCFDGQFQLILWRKGREPKKELSEQLKDFFEIAALYRDCSNPSKAVEQIVSQARGDKNFPLILAALFENSKDVANIQLQNAYHNYLNNLEEEEQYKIRRQIAHYNFLKLLTWDFIHCVWPWRQENERALRGWIRKLFMNYPKLANITANYLIKACTDYSHVQSEEERISLLRTWIRNRFINHPHLIDEATDFFVGLIEREQQSEAFVGYLGQSEGAMSLFFSYLKEIQKAQMGSQGDNLRHTLTQALISIMPIVPISPRLEELLAGIQTANWPTQAISRLKLIQNMKNVQNLLAKDYFTVAKLVEVCPDMPKLFGEVGYRGWIEAWIWLLDNVLLNTNVEDFGSADTIVKLIFSYPSRYGGKILEFFLVNYLGEKDLVTQVLTLRVFATVTAKQMQTKQGQALIEVIKRVLGKLGRNATDLFWKHLSCRSQQQGAGWTKELLEVFRTSIEGELSGEKRKWSLFKRFTR